MPKHEKIQTKIATQKSKGGSRNANFEDRELPKGAATRSYETAKGDGKGSSKRGTEPVVGKLGS